MEHQLGIPGSTKTFQENVDLDLHLSASDRGRLVLHILKSVVDSASVIISGFVVNSLDVDSYMDPELYCDLFTMAVHFHSYALFEGLR